MFDMTTSKEASTGFREVIRIWPHRSLSKRGFAIVMLVLGSLAFTIGLGFFLLGAWPVVGFLGLEFFVVWLVFKLNYHAAKKNQSVTVTGTEVQINTTYPNGAKESVSYPTAWVKIKVTPQGSPTIKSRYQQKITASSHGQSTIIADFIHPAETTHLARHINDMVDRARVAETQFTEDKVAKTDWATSLDEKTLRPH